MSTENSDLIEKAKKLYENLKQDGEASGYFLNPDLDFVMELMEGLLVNKERYGYLACPCRLSTGERDKDKDIICPCNYRDPDLIDYDACYCGLYMSKKARDEGKVIKPLPDRRVKAGATVVRTSAKESTSKSLSYPVWRCKVCGYLCARDNPPQNCPICKVDKDRFEKFI